MTCPMIDWYEITNLDFVQYQMTSFKQKSTVIKSDPASSTTTSAPVSSTTTVPYNKIDPVAEFLKSIKRDVTHYEILKDERFWDSWHRPFVVTARSHGLEKLLAKEYKPKDENLPLIAEQEKFFSQYLNVV